MSKNRSFGRPKTYRRHEDAFAFVPDSKAEYAVLEGVSATGTDRLREWVGARRENLLSPEVSFYAKVPAGYNDPRCSYYVLDALCRSKAGYYIRPNQLAHYLSQAYPQYYWDANILGRMLAGLNTANVEAYAVPQANGDVYEDDKKWVPFAQGRDTVGRYYVLDPNGGDEGRLWAMVARRVMLEKSQRQMRADLVAEFDREYGRRTSASDVYGEIMELVTPVRTKAEYRNQLRPDEEYERVATTGGFASPDVFKAPDSAADRHTVAL